LIGYNV